MRLNRWPRGIRRIGASALAVTFALALVAVPVAHGKDGLPISTGTGSSSSFFGAGSVSIEPNREEPATSGSSDAADEQTGTDQDQISSSLDGTSESGALPVPNALGGIADEDPSTQNDAQAFEDTAGTDSGGMFISEPGSFEAALKPSSADPQGAPQKLSKSGLSMVGPHLVLNSASLNVAAEQLTGAGVGDTADTGGQDSSETNNVVRTNDKVQYSVSISATGNQHSNLTVVFTLPKGQEWVPTALCKNANPASPASLPALTPPITDTSWESYPQQTVTCNLGNQGSSTLDASLGKYDFDAVVKPEVPNGTTMGPVDFTVSSTQVPTPITSNKLSQVVSAGPNYDVSKRGPANDLGDGGPFSVTSGACTASVPGRGQTPCTLVSYPLTISALGDGLGISPLLSPITITEDLDPATFFGAAKWAEMVASQGGDVTATTARYAPVLRECKPISSTSTNAFRNTLPYSTGGTTSNGNSVAHSGTVTCSTSRPGGQGTITITGANTSAIVKPARSGTNSSTLPNDRVYVVTLEVVVEVPQVALTDHGKTSVLGEYRLHATNSYVNIDMKGLDGTSSPDANPVNNVRSADIVLTTSGSFNKFFSGIYGASGNTEGSAFSGSGQFQGPPGSARWRDGNTTVMAGQAVQSVMSIQNQGLSGIDYMSSTFACDTWDPDRLALAGHVSWSGQNSTITQSGGKPVFPIYFRGNSDTLDPRNFNTANSPISNYKVQYAIGSPGGPNEMESCAGGTWYDSPDQVPGVTAETDSQGRTVWPGINKVRVFYTLNFRDYRYGEYQLYIAVGQVVLPSSVDEPIGNWAYRFTADNFDGESYKTPAEALAAPGPQTRRYVSDYNVDSAQGNYGDRLWLGEAIARISKEVRNPANGTYVGTSANYTAGVDAYFRLKPTLTSSVAPTGVVSNLVIEDCLPKYHLFKESAQGGVSLEPDLVQMGAPDSAGIACSEDRQYLNWVLVDLEVGTHIDPIDVVTEIVETAKSGVYDNEVVVSSPLDRKSPVSTRSDSVRVQLAVPSGVQISKTVDKPVIEINSQGVNRPRLLTWTISFVNNDVAGVKSNVDIIDVLPKNGFEGSNFSGTSEFQSATVAAGRNIQIRYTKALAEEIRIDATHASNGASGSTIWCSGIGPHAVIVSGSATDSNEACPRTESEVSGLRFYRPGNFTISDDFEIDIVTVPLANEVGDLYINSVAGRVDGIPLLAGPAKRESRVVGSSIGDTVFHDLNGNGIQDAGEPGLSGVPVRLRGTDSNLNSVGDNTVTDADGRYLFQDLASGVYKVIFMPDSLPVDWTLTSQNQGSDDAVDSDADPTTRETVWITLGPNSEDVTWDAGVIVDSNSPITMTKTLVSTTEPDSAREMTAVYELVVSNIGTATGEYTLKDSLSFADSIVIDAVSVVSVAPTSAAVVSTFDGQINTEIVRGQTIAAGARHTFRVAVDVTLPRVISVEDSDCTMVAGQSGTGLRNTATLEFNGGSLEQEACASIPTSEPFDAQVGNLVFEDTNGNGLADVNEPGVANFPVVLIGTAYDGTIVEQRTLTDAVGQYLFTGLKPGSYKVVFDLTGLREYWSFTAKDQGADDEADSDANPGTGETAQFDLADHAADLTRDAGIVIDRKADITLDKKFVSNTEPDAANKSTVIYDLVVTNRGSASGSYDLSDQLQYGGGIYIDKVTASVSQGSGVAVAPGFNAQTKTELASAQTLAGGETHTYRILVDVTLSTTLTSVARDCVVTTMERGSGFMNEASLTVDNVTVGDSACGAAPKPNPTPTPTPEPVEPPEQSKPNDNSPVDGGDEASHDTDRPKGNNDRPPSSSLPITGAHIGAGVVGALGLTAIGGLLLGVLRRSSGNAG